MGKNIDLSLIRSGASVPRPVLIYDPIHPTKAPQVVVKTTSRQICIGSQLVYRGPATSPAYTSTREKGACPPREYVTTVRALNGATYPPHAIFLPSASLGRRVLHWGVHPIKGLGGRDWASPQRYRRNRRDVRLEVAGATATHFLARAARPHATAPHFESSGIT
jgi:hypothetical protein